MFLVHQYALSETLPVTNVAVRVSNLTENANMFVLLTDSCEDRLDFACLYSIVLAAVG